MRKSKGHAHTILVSYNGKIADINEADVLKHTLDLQAALSETRTIVGAILTSDRITGTDNLYMYPNEGTYGVYANGGPTLAWDSHLVAVINNRLQYSQGAANDDFDLFCLGYFVEA